MAAENHHALRLPGWLWTEYAQVAGDVGRGTDLKDFMEWQAENPYSILGKDVAESPDFSTTIRVERDRWNPFIAALAGAEYSARLRAYIWWRIHHPEQPLPGRDTPPQKRQSGRAMACV